MRPLHHSTGSSVEVGTITSKTGHVFSEASIEIERYLTVAAEWGWDSVDDYADAKSEVIEVIIGRGR
jgi:hypothetical protein